MDGIDHRRLREEATKLLSGRVNKKEKARLKEIVEELADAFMDTKVELKSLEMAGLNGRDKAKLARLQSLHGRIINAQVCLDCKPYLDSMIEELRYT